MSGDFEKCGENLSQEDLQQFFNETLAENLIRNNEDYILAIMKARFEEYPTDKNNSEWLSFSDYIIKRRYEK